MFCSTVPLARTTSSAVFLRLQRGHIPSTSALSGNFFCYNRRHLHGRNDGSHRDNRHDVPDGSYGCNDDACDGNCKGTPFDPITGVFSSDHDFDTLVADDLEGASFGQEFIGSIPVNCLSHFDTIPYDVIINTVTKFNNTGIVITAEVVLLFIVADH